MTTSTFQLLHDADIQRALEAEDVRVFRYDKNEAGAKLLTGVGVLGIVFAVIVAAFTKLATGWFIALCIGAALTGAALLAYVWHWHMFVKEHFVALTEEHLYVGNLGQTGRAWKIDWTLLDPKTMGFDRLQGARLTKVLPISLAGESIKLHLFHPLAYMSDLQGLMLLLLEHIQRPEGEVVEEDDEEAEDVEEGA